MTIVEDDVLVSLDTKQVLAMRRKIKRDSRIASGLCGKCGKYPLFTSCYCESCHAQKAAYGKTYQKQQRQARVNKGICIRCGGSPLFSNSLSCEPCLLSERERTRKGVKKYLRERRENRLCQWCAEPLTDDHKAHCLKCRTILVSRTNARRAEVKKRAVLFLGGACKDCGLVTDVYMVYDFHHRDPSEKDFGISRYWSKDFDTVIVPELLKCDLLCANCHRTRHFREGKYS